VFHTKAFLYGLVGGVMGALLWALVVYFTDYEIGWIAWAVGGLVGYGVAFGNRGSVSTPRAAGILAVALTVLAIVGGKFLAIGISFPDDEELVELLLESTRNYEYTVSFLADAVAEEFALSARRVDWPPGVDPANAVGRFDFPADVWEEAENRWAAFSEEERTAFRDEVDVTTRRNIREQLPMIRPALRESAFRGSFGAMDLIFFGLAVVTAFGLAAGTRKTPELLSTEFVEAAKAAVVQVMLADGAPREEEVRVAREAYSRITGIEPGEDAFQREIGLARSEPSGLSNRLRQIAPFLNQRGKGLILHAAVSVAAADGEIHPEEQHVIRSIGETFGFREDQLPGLLASLQEGRPA